MKRIIKDYDRGLITDEKFIERSRACWGHMQHADAWNFAAKHLEPYTHLIDFRKSKKTKAEWLSFGDRRIFDVVV